MHLLTSTLLVIAVLALAVFIYERSRPRPRELMPVVVLAALAILGRIVAMPIPNFQPATALIVLAGYFFGRGAGLMCGLLTALVSNMVMGQGPWTPWQMLAWGLVGYGAGVLGEYVQKRNSDISQESTPERAAARKRTLILQVIVVAYGTVASLLFGMVLDLQFFIAYAWETGWAGLITTWSMGFPMNVMHAASTLIFLGLTLVPWGRKLQRLKTKYGLRPF
ncbi:MAG: ECF transporter S component [Coriobacteriia bacterium]|nr:ECF transporter S component [Coriobacteriia bacterium]MCL2536833.1 ECF transporter S component [Coriobacteriia bacterium]